MVLVLRSARVRGRILALGAPCHASWHANICPTALHAGVIATLQLARAIVLEATLSFLASHQPPTPSWGGMIQEGASTSTQRGGSRSSPGCLLLLTSLV